MNASELLVTGLTNAVLATMLAVTGWLLTRLWSNPHVASIVWLAVLLKLVTPPVTALPLPFDGGRFDTGRTSKSVPFDGEVRTERSGLGIENDAIDVVAENVSFPMIASDISRFPRRDHSPREPVEAPRPVELDGGRPSFSTQEVTSVQTVPSTLESLTREDASAAVSAAPVADSLSTDERAWKSILLAAWLIGTVLFALTTLCRVVRFHRTLQRAASVDHEMQRTAEHVASQLRLKRCPAVRSVTANVGPMVWAGSLRPLVIVPRPLWDALGEHERETLLTHELAHIVRRDHWVRRFEAVVLIFYWWLPTAWLAVRRREAAAETCCDALVLNHYPDRSQAYAEALLTAVTLLSTSRTPALASGLGRNHELKERLTMIVHDRVPRRPRRVVRWGVLLVATLALAIGATPSPEHAAQASDTPPEAEAAPVEAKSSGDAAAAVDEILFFHADWALHAQPMKQFFEKRRQEGLPVRLIDTTGKPEVMRANNVESIPTIVFLKNGKEVDRRVGTADDEKLRELLANHPTSGNGEGTEHAAQASDPKLEMPAGDTALPAAPSEPAPAEQVITRTPGVAVDEILFFHADWAGPSQQMTPIVEKLRQEGLPFRIVDVDREKELAKSMHVTSIPTLVVLRNGKEVNRTTGVKTEESLRAFVKRSPPADPGDSLSRETRSKIIDGLIAVVQDEKQPADVKAQAMRSLGNVAKGTDESGRVEQLLTDAAAASNDAGVVVAAGEALFALGSSKGVALMWHALRSSNDTGTQQSIVRWLDERHATPPTAETIRTLAQILDRYFRSSDASKPDSFTLAASQLLQRIVTNGDGVRRVVEAIEKTPQPSEEMPGEGKGAIGAEPPSRARTIILLPLLAGTNPTADDIAAVLVEALSHNDPDIREAAAKALGNAESTTAGRSTGRRPAGVGPFSTTPAELPPADVNNGPFAPAEPVPAKPVPTLSDDAVRKELLEPLIAAGQDEQATPESRIAALTAVARLSKTKTEKERAEEVVKAMLEGATDEQEKQALTLLLQELTEGESGLVHLWIKFANASDDEAASLLLLLNEKQAIPPNAKLVGRVMRWSVGDEFFARLVARPEGVERVIEAMGISAEPNEPYYASDMPVRDALLKRLTNIKPTSPDVAKVLAKALSHEDPAVRTAAATALGNYSASNDATKENPFGNRDPQAR